MLQRGPALILRVRVRVLVLMMMRMLLRVLDLVRMRVVQRRPGRMLVLVVMMIAITTLRTGLEDVGCALLLMIQPGIEVLFSSSPAHLPPVLLLLVLLQEGIGTATATAAGTSTNAEYPRRRIPLRRRRRTLLLLPMILPMGARPRTPSSSASHRDGLGLLERDGLGVIHGRLLRSRGGATARAPALLATSGGTVHRRTHTGLIRLLLLLIRSLAVLRVLALLLLLLLVLLLQTVVALGGVRDGRRRRRRGRAPAPTVAPTASAAAGWASTSSWHPRGRRGVGPEGRPLLLLLRLESSSSASAASGRAGPGPQHPVALVVRATARCCIVLL